MSNKKTTPASQPCITCTHHSSEEYHYATREDQEAKKNPVRVDCLPKKEWLCKASKKTRQCPLDGSTINSYQTCEDERYTGACGLEGKRWKR